MLQLLRIFWLLIIALPTAALSKVKRLKVDYLKHPVNTGGSAGVIKTAFAYAHYHFIYILPYGWDNQHMASNDR